MITAYLRVRTGDGPVVEFLLPIYGPITWAGTTMRTVNLGDRILKVPLDSIIELQEVQAA